MARKRFMGRRSPRTKYAKKRNAWTRALFGTAMDISGSPPDLVEHVLFDPLNDVMPGLDYHRKFTVKRIIARGQHQLFPGNVAAQMQPFNMTTALYVIDREDADGTLVSTTQGDILEGGVERVLYTDVIAGMSNEVTDAVRSAPLGLGPVIHVDWRGRALVGLDDLVVLGMQHAVAIDGTASSWTPFFVSSVLFEIT